MNRGGSQPPDRRSSRFLERLELRHDSGDMARVSVGSVSARPAPPPVRAGAVAPEQPSTREKLEPHPIRTYVETAVITAAFPLIGWAIDRNDPFFLRHAFSWIAVAPLLIALRHGFGLGFGSAMALDVALTVHWRSRVVAGAATPFPAEVAVGLIAVAMIAGQFADVFRRDSSRFRRGLGTARRRLDALSRAHFLLELSHDRLQQQQGPAAPNLRGAITAVQKLMGGNEAKSFADCADALLELYAAYFSVEVASIYAVSGGKVAARPLATTGQVHPLAPGDVLLADALKTRVLTHIPAALDKGVHPRQTNLLAVVPFVDTGDSIRGVLTIEAMPFIAFERRNLEAMVVLAGHVADLLEEDAAPSKRDDRATLHIAIERALSDLRGYGKPATLAGIRVPRDSRANDVIDVMLGSALRETDYPYAAYDPATGDLIVYVLLAMSDESVALTMFDRMARTIQRMEGTTLGALGVLAVFHVLRADQSVEETIKTIDARIRDNAQSVATTVAF